MYTLYADETKDESCGRITVAGYLIGSNQLKALTEKWNRALAEGPLDYFHAYEYAKSHPDIHRSLCNLINHDHIVAGFATSLIEDEYNEACSLRHRGQTLKSWVGGPYSFLVGAIADLANQWLNGHNREERHVAYVFEAGHPRQKEADYFLNMLVTDPALVIRKVDLRYCTHTFADSKVKDFPPAHALQAADILGWHLNALSRDGKFADEDKQIINQVETFGAHYSREAIVETMNSQVDLCKFYGELKQARVVMA